MVRIHSYFMELYPMTLNIVLTVVEEENNIVKNGFGDTLRIVLLKMSECPTYLKLKKQRFKCRECNSKFCAETSFLKKHCSISKNLIFYFMKNLPKRYSRFK